MRGGKGYGEPVREAAQLLKSQGFSYNAIAERLKISRRSAIRLAVQDRELRSRTLHKGLSQRCARCGAKLRVLPCVACHAAATAARSKHSPGGDRHYQRPELRRAEPLDEISLELAEAELERYAAIRAGKTAADLA